mgnify:FL=1
MVWCAANAAVGVEVSDSLLTPELGFVEYVWTGPEAWGWVDSLGGTVVAAQSGWFGLTAADEWGCEATAAPVLVCLDWGMPELGQTPNGALVATDGLATYAWWLDGEWLEGQESDSLLFPVPGSYVVEAADHANCPAVASEPWVVVSVEEREHEWQVGPNPFTEALFVQGVEGSGRWTVDAFDANGRKVASVSGVGAQGVELLREATKGVYYIGMEGRGVLKVVKGK